VWGAAQKWSASKATEKPKGQFLGHQRDTYPKDRANCNKNAQGGKWNVPLGPGEVVSAAIRPFSTRVGEQ